MRRLLGGLARAGRASLREWPLALALAGLASLFLLPRVVSRGAFRERGALDELRARLSAGDVPGFDARLRALLETASADTALRARRLAVEASLRRLREGQGEPLAEAARAREQLPAAADGASARELFRLLLARGYAREAADVAREAGASFELALALAEQSRQDPELSELLLREARERVAGEPPPRRSEIEARAGLDAAALAILPAVGFPLERGRLLARLDRPVEALAALDLAAEAAPGSDAPPLAELELFVRAGRPEAARYSGPMTPAARVLLALAARSGDALVTALAALPGPEPLENARLDPAWIADRLRAEREAETEPAAFARHVRILSELRRLYPGLPRFALEAGAAWRRSAELAPDPAKHRAAGEAFEAAAASRRLDGPALDRALREAAASFDAAGDAPRAAALYRRAYDLDPSRHRDALFHRAEVLARAGLWRLGAVEAYGEYLEVSGKGDARAPLALLRRGRLLESLGQRDLALADFDRVLREDHGISPRTPEWEEALLARGRCLLERARESGGDPALHAAGRRALEEYLERYASDTPRAGAVEAAGLLARAAIEDADAPAALTALAQASTLPAGDERARAVQREARHLLGEVLLSQGRAAEAEQAFARAGRGGPDDLDRVWSLAGRARALARLGRTGEAREEHRRAAALLEKGRAAGGRTYDYWRSELDALAKEVR